MQVLASLMLGFSLTASAATTPVSVNGVTIPASLIELELSHEPALQRHGTSSAEKMQRYRDEALERLVRRELLFPEAERRRLAPANSLVDEKVDAAAERMGGLKKLTEALARGGLSLARYHEWIRKDLACSALEKELRDSASVSEKEARAHYDANQDLYIQPAKARVTMLYFALMPFTAETEAEGKHRMAVTAATLWRENPATDATALAAKFGAELRDLGVVHRGAAIEALDQPIFNSKEGEVPEPVRSIYGWHVLKVESTQEARQLPYAEVKETVMLKLQKQRGEANVQEAIGRLRADAVIRPSQ